MSSKHETEQRSRPATRQGIVTALCSGAAVVAVSSLLLVRHQTALGFALGVVLVGVVAATVMRTGRPRVFAVVAGIALVLLVIGSVLSSFPVWLAAQSLSIALPFAYVLAVRKKESARTPATSPFGRVRRVAAIGGLTIAGVVSLALITVHVTPLPVGMALQSATNSTNSFDAHGAEGRVEFEEGTRITKDIRYGTEFPNSFLDIYIADNDTSVARPTVIALHGGGFVVGSKEAGDPSNGVEAFALGQGALLDNGYNLVTLDYALAPQFRHPTPVIQTSQAVDFLKEHSDEFGLDMSRVVITGGSAGGHLAAQYALIQTDEAYAKEVGIPATLPDGELKAALLDSAPLDTTDLTTQAPVLYQDWLFTFSGRAYLGLDATRSEVPSIIDNVTAAYPPTLVADGNTGTWPQQAARFADRLTALGVRNELSLVPRSEAQLGHAYMGIPSRWTDQLDQQKVRFLDSVMQTPQ